MFHELTVKIDREEYLVGCVLPSPLFPLPRLAIAKVHAGEEDKEVGSVIFGTPLATKIRRAVERAVQGRSPVPSALYRELKTLEAGAPSAVANLSELVETVRGVVRRGHLGRDRAWTMERFYDVDEWPAVLLYRADQPRRLFAVIKPLEVTLFVVENDRLACLEITLALKDDVALAAYAFDAGGLALIKSWVDEENWLIEQEDAASSRKLSLLVTLRLNAASEELELVRAIAGGKVSVH